MEKFFVKHYSSDERPIIKGNGFDGLSIGEERGDAEEFVSFINRELEAANQRELELMAVIERMKAASKFVHEDLVIRAKLAEDDSLNISQSALDGLIESIAIEPYQALREHEAEVLEEAAEVFEVIGHSQFKTPAEELQRMAEERRKN